MFRHAALILMCYGLSVLTFSYMMFFLGAILVDCTVFKTLYYRRDVMNGPCCIIEDVFHAFFPLK